MTELKKTIKQKQFSQLEREREIIYIYIYKYMERVVMIWWSIAKIANQRDVGLSLTNFYYMYASLQLIKVFSNWLLINLIKQIKVEKHY